MKKQLTGFCLLLCMTACHTGSDQQQTQSADNYTSQFRQIAAEEVFSLPPDLAPPSEPLPETLTANWQLEQAAFPLFYRDLADGRHRAYLVWLGNDPLETRIDLLVSDSEGRITDRYAYAIGNYADTPSGLFRNTEQATWYPDSLVVLWRSHEGNGDSPEPDLLERTRLQINTQGKIRSTNTRLPSPEGNTVTDFMVVRYSGSTSYSVVGIYPYQESPAYFTLENEQLRFLEVDEEQSLGNTVVFRDAPFSSLSWLRQEEREGISLPMSINLSYNNGTEAMLTGRLSSSESTLKKGAYLIDNQDIKGFIILQPSSHQGQWWFELDTSTSQNHICNFGNLQKAAAVGSFIYYKGHPFDDTCALLMYHRQDTLQVFLLTSPQACGCGEGATPEGLYRLR